MSTTPEALADKLIEQAKASPTFFIADPRIPAAAELRRLAAVEGERDELLQLLSYERERLNGALDARIAERNQLRAQVDNAVSLLTGIHSLLYPAPITTADGRTLMFRPEDPSPHEVLQELSDRIRALPEKLAALQWQPIETAPKDGTQILAWAPDIPGLNYYGVALWADENGPGTVAGWFWPYATRPTHWMPLPVPPKA